jgi:hypothetical protein
MYEVLNEDYPNLETYLCYECGFHADTILMQQKALYQQYQWLFSHSNGALIPKKILPTRNQQHFKHGEDSTEPMILILYLYFLINNDLRFILTRKIQ